MAPRANGRLIAVAAAVAALASGCGDDGSPYYGTSVRPPRSPTTYYVNAGAEPEYIDPGRVSEGIGSLLANHLFEGLSVYDPRDLHPTQGVASSWDRSDDNRVFRFHLRREAVWSDGKRVTAGDFAYAWARALRPSLASRGAANLHVLRNGELYSAGKLKITKGITAVTSAPGGQAVQSTLPAGTAVQLLKTEGSHAQIALHARLPTYDPDRVAATDAAPVEPPPLGYVRSDDLVLDPSVLGVRAVDDDTLEVETERPAPYFLELTCYAVLSPMRRDIVEPLEKDGDVEAVNHPERLVYNGAYSIEQWKFRYEIRLAKSPTYWRAPEVKIEHVVWTMVEDYRATLNLYKTGELDYIGDTSSISPEAMPVASKKKDFLRSNYLNVYWLVFNVHRPPVDDVRVRRALNLAVDKRQIVQNITKGGQQPATHYVPDFAGSGYAEAAAADKKSGTDPFSGPGLEFDPERARASLREAGYEIVKEDGGYRAKGFPPLELLYNTGEGHRAIAVAIQDFWRRHLGIAVALRNEEWKVMLKNAQQGNFQILRGGWTADYNHPQTWLDTFVTKNPQNYGDWSDPAYDALVKEASATADPAESIRKFRKAERYLVDAMPKLPLYFYTRSMLVKPWVKGFYANARSIHAAQWLWIDPGLTAENRPAMPPLDYPPPGTIARRQPPPPSPGGAP